MNWDQVAGDWKQFMGKVKQKWGKLTDSDQTTIAGKRDQLAFCNNGTSTPRTRRRKNSTSSCMR